MNSYIKLVTALSIVGALALTFGHGCGKFVSDTENFNALNQQEDPNSDLTIIPGAKTVGLVYSRQFLDNMVSCTGIGKPSLKTKASFDNRRGSLSKYGYANKVSGPGLMAIAAVAGEVCDDLISKEKTTPRIFPEVNFSSALNANDLQNGLRRMALSCWQRQPTNEEVSTILNSITDMNNDGGLSSADAAMVVCTQVLAVLNGIEL